MLRAVQVILVVFGFVYVLGSRLLDQHCASQLARDPADTIAEQLCSKYNGYAATDVSASLTLITYADERAFPYFAYSAMVLERYAQRHGFRLLLFCATHRTASNERQEGDARWEKVRILRHLLLLPRLPSVGYVAWMDADMIPLNLTHSLAAIAHAFPSYDVIVSAELHGGTGVANTGCILLKLSPWSLAFVSAWWETDHRLGHDQILFNVVYQQRLPDVKQHVRIVPTHWLNSVPPAYLRQMPSHPMLHLMGERNDVRAAAFRSAVQYICNAVRDAHSEEALAQALEVGQLGLTRSHLKGIVWKISQQRLKTLITDIHNYRGVESMSSVRELLVLVSEARELLLVLQRLGAGQPFLTEQYRRLYSLLQSVVLFDHGLQSQLISYKGTVLPDDMPLDSPDVFKGLHTLSLLGNDLLTGLLPSSDSAAEVEELFSDVSMYLSVLLNQTALASRTPLQENQAMLLHSRAEYYMSELRKVGIDRTALLRKAEDCFKQCLRILQNDIEAQQRNEYHHILPLLGIASLLCDQHNYVAAWEEGMRYYVELVTLLQRLLSVEEQFKSEHQQLIIALQGAIACGSKLSREQPALLDTVMAYRSQFQNIEQLQASSSATFEAAGVVTLDVPHKMFRRKKADRRSE